MQKHSSFGLKARTSMLKKKLTLTALAKQLEISTSYLSYILAGEREGKKIRGQIIQILGLKGEQA